MIWTSPRCWLRFSVLRAIGCSLPTRGEDGLRTCQEALPDLVTLHNLDAFREAYGFATADDALRAVVLLLERTLDEAGMGKAFVGHLTPTDFLILAPLDARGRLPSGWCAAWSNRRNSFIVMPIGAVGASESVRCRRALSPTPQPHPRRIRWPPCARRCWG